jgi:hypothetical protein
LNLKALFNGICSAKSDDEDICTYKETHANLL